MICNDFCFRRKRFAMILFFNKIFLFMIIFRATLFSIPYNISTFHIIDATNQSAYNIHGIYRNYT